MNFLEYMQHIYALGRKEAFRYVRDGQEILVNGEQWVREIVVFARWMQAKGISDENIGLAVKNCYEWSIVVFAAGLTGNTAVSLNYGLAAEDLREQIERSDITMLFVRENSEVEAEAVPDDVEILDLEQILAQASQAFDCWEDLTYSFENFVCDVERSVLILFSSGTSGLPKGVMLSQRNLLSILQEPPNEVFEGRFLLSLPLYHISGINLLILYLYVGVTVCVCEEVKYLTRDIVKFSPTVLSMVPSHIDFLAGQCRRKKALALALKENTKKIISLGALLVNTHEDVFEPLGVQIVNAYGLTETTGIINMWHPARRDTLGRPAKRIQCRVCDGEFQLRGDCVMLGYYKNEEATREMIQDGWLCTGDLIELNSDGYMVMKGRKKNIIILSNGENVSPEVLENKILAMGEVQEVIVRGEEDVIVAIFYLGDDNSRERELLWERRIDELNRHLPPYQKIQAVTFRQEPLPKTGSGKIKRNRI